MMKASESSREDFTLIGITHMNKGFFVKEKWMLILLVSLCTVIGLIAQEGQNLILNSDFSDLKDGRPNYWTSSPEPFSVFHEGGGPNGMSYLSSRKASINPIRYRNGASGKRAITLSTESLSRESTGWESASRRGQMTLPKSDGARMVKALKGSSSIRPSTFHSIERKVTFSA